MKITKDKSKLTVTTEIQMSKRCAHLDCCWHRLLLVTAGCMFHHHAARADLHSK